MGIEDLSEISICVLTHNRSEQLLRTLNNLLDEFGDSLEVLILNNGSFDRTRAMLEKDFGDVRSFRVFHSVENLGVSLGREVLWKSARGKTILSMDDDIMLSRGALESMMSCLALDDKIGVVSPNIRDAISGRLLNADSSWGNLPTFYEACFLIRMDVVGAVGGFDARLRFAGEGLDYALRLQKAKFKVVRDRNVSVIHYDRPRDSSDLYVRRLQWLWSFCFVYWKNLRTHEALYWSLRNLVGHARAGTPVFGWRFAAKLPKYAIKGGLAGLEARWEGGAGT